MSLLRSLNFEKVLPSISSRFVDKINLDDAINSSFEDLGHQTQSSRLSLFLFNCDKRAILITHEWCTDGISPQLNNLERIKDDKIS